MSEEFSKSMKVFFGADRGGYSVVTKNEYEKSQITFVGPEQDLAEAVLGSQLDDRHGSVGAIQGRGIDPDLEYRLYPSGKVIRLTTSYKTNKPRELRLYLRAGQFKPDRGWYWGIFERAGTLWLCEMSSDLLNKINSNSIDLEDRGENLEPEEDGFQEDLNGKTPPEKQKNEVYAYGRNRKFALQAIQKAKFSCELFPEYPTFLSRASGMNFMEAHHLIPMKFQPSFNVSLDVPDNICCLNPLSHRLVHFGSFVAFEERMTSLVKLRSDFIKSVGWIEDDVLALYAI